MLALLKYFLVVRYLLWKKILLVVDYTSVQATVQLSGMGIQPQLSAKAAVGIYNLTNILISYSMAQLHTQQQILVSVNTVRLQFKIV